MSQSIALLVGAALIAAAIAVSHRYQIASAMLAPDYVMV